MEQDRRDLLRSVTAAAAVAATATAAQAQSKAVAAATGAPSKLVIAASSKGVVETTRARFAVRP